MKKIPFLLIVIIGIMIELPVNAQKNTFTISLSRVVTQPSNTDSTVVIIYYINESDSPDNLIVKYGETNKPFFGYQVKEILANDAGSFEFIIPTTESSFLELGASSWGGTAGKNSDKSSKKISR